MLKKIMVRTKWDTINNGKAQIDTKVGDAMCLMKLKRSHPSWTVASRQNDWFWSLLSTTNAIGVIHLRKAARILTDQ